MDPSAPPADLTADRVETTWWTKLKRVMGGTNPTMRPIKESTR
jgi:hypothetical protein